MRIALERAMQRNANPLPPSEQPRIPDNHPDSSLISPQMHRAREIDIRGAARLRELPENFEEIKARIEKALGHPLTEGVRDVKAPVGQGGWVEFTRGTLTPEDLPSTRTKNRLDKEWNNWLNNGDKKIIKSLKNLGVHDLDFDWAYFKSTYKA